MIKKEAEEGRRMKRETSALWQRTPRAVTLPPPTAAFLAFYEWARIHVTQVSRFSVFLGVGEWN